MLQVGSCPAVEHMGSAACTEWAGEERPPTPWSLTRCAFSWEEVKLHSEQELI